VSTLESLLSDLANHHEAIAQDLRAYANAAHERQTPLAEAPFPDRVIAAARSIHNAIGSRQVEALRHIAEAHPDGITTGPVAKKMNYDQPNLYLTLQALMRPQFGLVRKDDAVSPHRYYLTDKLVEATGGE
jgi:hypothetical protein